MSERVTHVDDYLEGLMEGFVAYDRDWRMTYMNAAAERILGRRRAEVLGKTWQQAFPHAVGNPVDQMYRRVMRSRTGERMEYYYPHYGRWLEISAAPVRSGGVGVYFRDISDRKEAELALREKYEEMQALLGALPVGVFISQDAACTDIRMNPAGAALLRIPQGTNASKTGPAPLPFRVLKNGVEMADEDLPMQRAARLGRTVLGEEVDIVFSDGTAISLYEHAVPLFDPAGHVRGCVGLFVDITERRRFEQALREAARRKDEFLATLSHELRNPLAPLRSALELLGRSGLAQSRATEIRDMMERQVNHLVRMVDDLMEISRITRGTLELRRESVSLQAVLRNALETSKPLISAAGHDLSVALPAEPAWLYADAVRLAQVFSNLLNNAARYTDAGGRIALEVERTGGEVEVHVSDTGQGIDPVRLPQLFEIFSQSAPSAHRQGGLGIGLALVRRLVEMHGGSVRAESEGPGKGSRFTVRLALAATPGSPEAPGAPASRADVFKDKRILVVDDNRDAAESLALLLESLGARVTTANDGPAALAALDACTPALVLLDLGMPRMDGYEVAQRIRRARDGDAPALVALTGWGQAQDRERSREAGFDFHLTKPADVAALQALLASLTAKGLV